MWFAHAAANLHPEEPLATDTALVVFALATGVLTVLAYDLYRRRAEWLP